MLHSKNHSKRTNGNVSHQEQAGKASLPLRQILSPSADDVCSSHVNHQWLFKHRHIFTLRTRRNRGLQHTEELSRESQLPQPAVVPRTSSPQGCLLTLSQGCPRLEMCFSPTLKKQVLPFYNRETVRTLLMDPTCTGMCQLQRLPPRNAATWPSSMRLTTLRTLKSSSPVNSLHPSLSVSNHFCPSVLSEDSSRVHQSWSHLPCAGSPGGWMTVCRRSLEKIQVQGADLQPTSPAHRP